MAEIRWSLAAERDLRLIEEFIARDSPLPAVAFVNRLVSAAASLEKSPRLGRIVPEFQQADPRELIVRGYRLVYLLQESDVTILRVVHDARDLSSLANREPWDLG